jgi:hypothetical protein
MTGTSARSVAFRRRWWRQSLAEAWSAPAEEWYCREVDAVAAALAESAERAAIDACDALGAARACAGVFLDEARADLAVATRLASADRGLSTQLLDRLTVRWVDRTLDLTFTSPCVDPLTGLASVPYLTTRLREVYAEAQLQHASAAAGHVLVVVRTALCSNALLAKGRLVTLESVMRYAFPGGETLAAVGTHGAVALAERSEPRLTESLAVLRSELRRVHRGGLLPEVATRVVALPPHRDQLPALLRELMR